MERGIALGRGGRIDGATLLVMVAEPRLFLQFALATLDGAVCLLTPVCMNFCFRCKEPLGRLFRTG